MQEQHKCTVWCMNAKLHTQALTQTLVFLVFPGDLKHRCMSLSIMCVLKHLKLSEDEPFSHCDKINYCHQKKKKTHHTFPTVDSFTHIMIGYGAVCALSISSHLLLIHSLITKLGNVEERTRVNTTWSGSQALSCAVGQMSALVHHHDPD